MCHNKCALVLIETIMGIEKKIGIDLQRRIINESWCQAPRHGSEFRKGV
ncbi:MAG: hypothetical protein Q7U88_16830 [Desulfocapsaceae bacterium]|nr:hypothetical protein [Desulfocapsaceae bacterium]